MATTCSFGQIKDIRLTSLCHKNSVIIDTNRNIRGEKYFTDTSTVSVIEPLSGGSICINDTVYADEVFVSNLDIMGNLGTLALYTESGGAICINGNVILENIKYDLSSSEDCNMIWGVEACEPKNQRRVETRVDAFLSTNQVVYTNRLTVLDETGGILYKSYLYEYDAEYTPYNNFGRLTRDPTTGIHYALYPYDYMIRINDPFIGSFTDLPYVNDYTGIACSSDGTMYAALYDTNDNSILVTIDKDTTDIIDTIGDIGFGIAGMDFHPTTGELYASIARRNSGNKQGLITIDINTGAGTFLIDTNIKNRQLSPSGSRVAGFGDIAFHPDGRLFALTGYWSFPVNCLIEIGIEPQNLGDIKYHNGFGIDSYAGGIIWSPNLLIKVTNTGTNNTVIGHKALVGATEAANVIAIGKESCYQDSVLGTQFMEYNIAIGNYSMKNANVNDSIAIGQNSMYGSECKDSIAMGTDSLYGKVADNSICVGHQSEINLGKVIRETVLIGHDTAQRADMDQSVVVGHKSLDNASNLVNTTVVGMSSLKAHSGTIGNCVVIGDFAMNSFIEDGDTRNTVFGHRAMTNVTTGKDNVLGGNDVFSRVTTGPGGDLNVVIGDQAQSGSDFTINKNVLIGAHAHLPNNSNENVFIGWKVGEMSTQPTNSSVCIGHDSWLNDDRNLLIGGNSYITQDHNSVIGANTHVIGSYNIAVGNNNRINHSDCVVLAHQTETTDDGEIRIGSNIYPVETYEGNIGPLCCYLNVFVNDIEYRIPLYEPFNCGELTLEFNNPNVSLYARILPVENSTKLIVGDTHPFAQNLLSCSIRKWNSNNTLDNTFPQYVFNTYPPAPGIGYNGGLGLRDIGVLSDGSVICVVDALHGWAGGGWSTFVYKLRPTGGLDPTFGVGSFGPSPTPGLWESEYTGPGFANIQYQPYRRNPLLVMPDDSFYVFGQRNNGSNPQTSAVYKFLGSGLDLTFGTSGLLEFTPDPYITGGWSFNMNHQLGTPHLLSTGKFIYVGDVYDNPYTGLRTTGLVRMNANGTIDTTYGTNGFIIITEAGCTSLLGFVSLVFPDDSIVLIGSCISMPNPRPLYAWKVDPNGNLDTSWGVGGKFTYQGIPEYAILLNNGCILCALDNGERFFINSLGVLDDSPIGDGTWTYFYQDDNVSKIYAGKVSSFSVFNV